MELVKLETLSVDKLFDGSNLERVLANIQIAVDNLVLPDPDTAKHRKEIASYAYQISRVKGLIDKARKEAKAEAQAMVKRIDEKGRHARLQLEALQKQVRQPLTEWEEREAKRVAEIKDRLHTIESYGQLPAGLSSEELQTKLAELKAIKLEGFAEYQTKAVDLRNAVQQILETAIGTALQREKAEAEAKAREEEQKRKELEAWKAKVKAEAEAAAKEAAKRKAEQLRRQLIVEAKAKAEAEAKAELAKYKKQVAKKAKEKIKEEVKKIATQEKKVEVKEKIKEEPSKNTPDRAVLVMTARELYVYTQNKEIAVNIAQAVSKGKFTYLRLREQ